METFFALLAHCKVIHRSPVVSFTKVSYAELWRFLWSVPEQTVELNKQSRRWWFETSSRWLWHHCNEFHMRETSHQLHGIIDPLWGELSGDRWIPLTKGPVIRKTFPGQDAIPHAYHVTLTDRHSLQSLGQWLHQYFFSTLQWRHNGHDSVSNHQLQDCLLNRLFRRRSKKTSRLPVTSLCVGNSPGPVNSPHKRPVMRKMFPFDNVIMRWQT